MKMSLHIQKTIIGTPVKMLVSKWQQQANHMAATLHVDV